MYDIIPHLARQAAFSRATFGPGPRTKGVSDHIRKELVEIEEIEPPTGTASVPESMSNVGRVIFHSEQAEEWTDVAILALDGLLRAIWAAHPGWTSDQVAASAVDHIRTKQGKNERREWPDWRGASPDQAIEHVRGIED